MKHTPFRITMIIMPSLTFVIIFNFSNQGWTESSGLSRKVARTNNRHITTNKKTKWTSKKRSSRNDTSGAILGSLIAFGCINRYIKLKKKI